MKKKSIIYNLIIANLVLLFFYLLGKFNIVGESIKVFIGAIVTPIVFGVFIFYILRPLNEIFIKKGLKRSRGAALTLIIVLFVLSGIIKYFGEYFINQVMQLKDLIMMIITEENIITITKGYMENEKIAGVISNVSTALTDYITFLVSNTKVIFDKGMMAFSNVLLVILIAFFLLKDGHLFKEKVLRYCPKKYMDLADDTLSEGHKVLSTYIIGQTVVALSLAIMVFIGYIIIGMPSALLLSSITFILAFIPFVGFFISMILPYIIALIMGFDMVFKLSILFIIAQTLKGRVVVPFIMGRAMKIHPITDIFLVVAAAAISGPLAAFCIIPIYSLLKVLWNNLRKIGISKTSLVDKINKV